MDGSAWRTLAKAGVAGSLWGEVAWNDLERWVHAVFCLGGVMFLPIILANRRNIVF